MPDLDLGPLDDSRLKGYNGKVTHPTLPLERTYCSICGTPKGWVTHESSEFIDAANVVVVCDNCDEKLRSKLGQPPLQEAPVREFNLLDAVESGSSLPAAALEWQENCTDCRVPMVKLPSVPPGTYKAIMETMRLGQVKLNDAQKQRLIAISAHATPTWLCSKCKSLWGAIDMFWCKFRKA